MSDMTEAELNELSDEALLVILKNNIAEGISIFEKFETRIAHRKSMGETISGEVVISSRELSLARTYLETAGLWIIAEDASEHGSCIQDGLRGI